MPHKKKSPFRQFGPVETRGSVIAVQFHEGLWCYVRRYFLCDGFLPFFSKSPLTSNSLPTLRAERFFDLWCYDFEPTPMQFVGRFPFENKEESYGEPYYTPPDVIDNVYTIHEMRDGMPVMRKTKDPAEVKGMRRQRRYQPPEFHEVLADVLDVWPVVDGPA